VRLQRTRAVSISNEAKRKELEVIVDMASTGVSLDKISKYLAIPLEILRTKVREIIEHSPQTADNRVLKNLLEMAAGGRNAATTLYWVKTRCGWNNNEPPSNLKPPRKKGLPDFRVYINDGEPNYDG
jgi:hypothetical protein